MADPAKISVILDVPILGQILEAVRALGAQSADFSVRLQAIEARLTVAPTADGASFIGPDDRSPYHPAGDDGHITPSADEAFATAFHSATYQPEFAPDQTSSIPKHVFASNPRPRSGRPADRSALGKKRKRADSDQFAEAPSRSESPLDKRDAESTSDGLDSMPPLRPQQAASMLPPRARSRRHQSPQDHQPGESVLEADELPNISQSGRVRKQTPRQTGFVGLPTKKEINRDSRLTKRGSQR
ncbi:hypothetical protein D6D26_08084 [Aureobasidium pullulans]|nr:hypothetical protein D6D26_08084 [Aureobasidium pullulans]